MLAACQVELFQSHAGSIEAQKPAAPLRGGGLVSIPRWFD